MAVRDRLPCGAHSLFVMPGWSGSSGAGTGCAGSPSACDAEAAERGAEFAEKDFLPQASGFGICGGRGRFLVLYRLPGGSVPGQTNVALRTLRRMRTATLHQTAPARGRTDQNCQRAPFTGAADLWRSAPSGQRNCCAASLSRRDKQCFGLQVSGGGTWLYRHPRLGEGVHHGAGP